MVPSSSRRRVPVTMAPVTPASSVVSWTAIASTGWGLTSTNTV